MKKYSIFLAVLVLTLSCLTGCRRNNNPMAPSTTPATHAPTAPVTTPSTTSATEHATTPTAQTETRNTESTTASQMPDSTIPEGTGAAEGNRSRHMPKNR